MNDNVPENKSTTLVQAESVEKILPEPIVSEQTSQSRTDTVNTNAVIKSGPSWLLWALTLLVVVVSAGVSVYLWRSDDKLLQQLQANLAVVSSRMQEQAVSSNKTLRNIDSQNQVNKQQQDVAQRQLQDQIERLKQQLSSQQKRLRSLSTTDRNDWLLAEAEYLMRLANQRLLMGKEASGAKQLLKAADDIIRDLDDHALHTVRKALAQEIAAIHTAANFDVQGLYLQLEAVALQADQLRLLLTLVLDTPPPANPVAKDWQQQFAFGFSAALEKLSKYIQINRRDEKYKPMLAPEYEAAVRQNVRLMFEQAQLALLSANQMLYEKSLGKAKQWLETYYSLDKESTQKIIMLIEQLEQEIITVTLPDISGSLRALKDYVNTEHSLAAAGAALKAKPDVDSAKVNVGVVDADKNENDTNLSTNSAVNNTKAIDNKTGIDNKTDIDNKAGTDKKRLLNEKPLPRQAL